MQKFDLIFTYYNFPAKDLRNVEFLRVAIVYVVKDSMDSCSFGCTIDIRNVIPVYRPKIEEVM